MRSRSRALACPSRCVTNLLLLPYSLSLSSPSPWAPRRFRDRSYDDFFMTGYDLSSCTTTHRSTEAAVLFPSSFLAYRCAFAVARRCVPVLSHGIYIPVHPSSPTIVPDSRRSCGPWRGAWVIHHLL
ncbi:hypothetical protein L227DRAFT_577556 [Lentinus tigrinus ALCF2SS1-6]|uniref:Secreted protein n=1 Tax=Lentinus tigrinus ALCF2SS1-6 TaxID=1328759 RepID=A0A5C2S2Y1_9APHY|nr:hypothetical protein L227DRAFT_577556 [Lentinus tigrinus ALCF2SS1-6]